MKEKQEQLNERPTVQNEKAGERYAVYATTLQRVNEAIEQGFFLEAIALIESIISHRLASIINEVMPDNKLKAWAPFSSLVDSLHKAVDKNLMPQDLLPILDKIDLWSQDRNNAIHGMAKDLEQDFIEKYDKLEEVADNGLEYFRELDNYIRNFRKINN